MRLVSRALLTSGIAVLVVGCSGIRVAYNTADFFIERFADDYLGLDSAQMQRWTPVLDAALSRHREDELPYLAAFFDAAQADARKGFSRADVRCLLDQFEVIYRRHFRLATETAAPLLADLTAEQIQALERKFREEAAEDAAASALPEAVRVAKRVKRYRKNMRWWVGDLTEAQVAIVSDVVSGLPDSAGWYVYRDQKRRELIALARADGSEARIKRFLVDWLVEYEDLPATLETARGQLQNGIIDLFVRLDDSFSSAQRKQLVRRLTRLRDDFKALQRNPSLAPTPC
jgi:hypothetical protein